MCFWNYTRFSALFLNTRKALSCGNLLKGRGEVLVTQRKDDVNVDGQSVRFLEY